MDTNPPTPVKKILAIGLVIALVIFLGLAAYLYWGQKKGGPEPVKETPPRTAEAPAPAVAVTPMVETPAAESTGAVDVCKKNREQLLWLFSYLDRQDYISSRHLEGGSLGYFRKLLARLLETPPCVLLETDSLLKVLRNRAHFYRALGKKDTLFLRDILNKEGDLMEPAFAILYQTFALQEKCRKDGSVLNIPIGKVYPYAVFFLNTLGGSSYLIRRDSRVRLLTQYYSILVIDQANRRRLNKLGLNILSPLDILVKNLKGSTNLSHKDEYLDTLRNIRAGY